MSSDYIIIFCTTSSEAEAVQIANELLEHKLCACVNILKPIRSIYSWKDKICDDTEVLMIIKTQKSLFDPVQELILKIHSYETPEIIALPIISGNEKYLGWIKEVTVDKE